MIVGGLIRTFNSRCALSIMISWQQTLIVFLRLPMSRLFLFNPFSPSTTLDSRFSQGFWDIRERTVVAKMSSGWRSREWREKESLGENERDREKEKKRERNEESKREREKETKRVKEKERK